MEERGNPQEELAAIDAQLAQLKHGQLVVRRLRGAAWIFRIHKEGARTCSESIGPEGGEMHLAALEQLRKRRDLSRRRRELGRAND